MVFVLVLAFFYFLYRLIQRIGKTFPLFELVAVLYLLQNGIAPLLEYRYSPYNTMALSQEDYLQYATIACLAFIGGLFYSKSKFSLTGIKIASKEASKLGRLLIVVSYLAVLSKFFLPEVFYSTIQFFILFKVVGVYSLVFSDNKQDRVLVGIIFLEIAIGAILNALLIEFIIFSIFLATFFTIRYKISTKIKFLVVASSLLFLTIYQGVKAEYRKSTWESDVDFETKTLLLSNLINADSFTAAFNVEIENNETILKTFNRLNQGWHIAMVMNHVPRVVEFQNGKDFLNDITSSLLPRFLWPTKRVVNDYRRFNYYTGYNINASTSMTFGIIGDFYLNFGWIGSIIMLFLLGVVISKISNWFYKKYIFLTPINLIWVPFIFSYLIRPGNEFYMFLNHLIKALIVFYIVQTYLYPTLKRR